MAYEIGLIGLGRMGQNLAANMIEHDISIKAWGYSSRCWPDSERVVGKNLAGGLQGLASRASVNVALPVIAEVGPAERAVLAPAPVPDRDVRFYTLFHQPSQALAGAIGGIRREAAAQKRTLRYLEGGPE